MSKRAKVRFRNLSLDIFCGMFHSWHAKPDCDTGLKSLEIQVLERKNINRWNFCCSARQLFSARRTSSCSTAKRVCIVVPNCAHSGWSLGQSKMSRVHSAPIDVAWSCTRVEVQRLIVSLSETWHIGLWQQNDNGWGCRELRLPPVVHVLLSSRSLTAC
jgi:hypothetical protein